MTPNRASAFTALAVLTASCTVQPLDRSADALHDLFDEAWTFQLQEDPLQASRVGDEAANDRLPSMAPEDLARRDAFWRDALSRLDEIDRNALGNQDRINYDIFRTQLENRIRDYELGGHLLPLTVDSGFHIGFARLPAQMPFRNARDYTNYVARLDGAPTYFGQYTELLRGGLAEGMTLAAVILDGYEITIDTHVVDDVETSVFWAPFAAFGASLSPADRDRISAEGRRAIQESVVPAYRAFLEFMTGEYVPGARPTIGAYDLPNGREY